MVCRLQRRPSLRRLWPLQVYLNTSTIVQVIQAVLRPERIVVIAGGLVLGICEENMVWFLFHEHLIKLFDFTTYFRYSRSFRPGA
jgi:hypothetical protein